MENLPSAQVGQSQLSQPTPFVLANLGDQNENTNFDFWGVVNRRKWLLFLGLLTGVILGALYNAQANTRQAATYHKA